MAFSVILLIELRKEHPELFDDHMVSEMKELLGEAVRQEIEWAYVIGNAGIERKDDNRLYPLSRQSEMEKPWICPDIPGM